LKGSFINVVLVELWHYDLDHNAEVHVMMCEQFTGLLRNPKGATQTLAEATASAKRLAKTMPPCRALMKMINDGNRHLCAAVVRLDERCWTFFDPDPECSELHEVEPYGKGLLDIQLFWPRDPGKSRIPWP